MPLVSVLAVVGSNAVAQCSSGRWWECRCPVFERSLVSKPLLSVPAVFVWHALCSSGHWFECLCSVY